MDLSQFKNTKPYPERPKPPVLPKNPTPDDYRKHATALEGHADVVETFNKARQAYDNEECRIDNLAMEAMLKDVGLDKHPKRAKIYYYAWERGHSGGYNDVWCVLCDIADLFKD